jgi:hypothetical protein
VKAPPDGDGRPSTHRDGPPLTQPIDTEQTAKTTGSDAESSAEADAVVSGEHRLLADLLALGCTVWVGQPGWVGGPEIRRPKGWQDLDASGNEDRLRAFVAGRDALCLNTGTPVAVVDVDVQNGGDVEQVRALLARLGVTIFAEVRTPGGGVHFYVHGHPDLVSTHSTEQNQKLPGFGGVDVQSFRCNVFLPSTSRPKYDGRGYAIISNVLDRLAMLADGDDGGALALADWVAEQRADVLKAKARTTSAGAKEWTWDPCEPWNGTPPDRRQSAYLHAAVTGETDKVAKTASGGRNNSLFEAALKMGSYVAGAGLDEPVVIAALQAAAVTNGLTAEDGVQSVRATIRSGLRAGKKNPRAVPPQPDGAVTVDLEEFWELTDTLRHIRDFAHARLCGPWAVLGVAMARVIAVIPPTVQLPPWVGGNASLNSFIALVGVSGEGKGIPEKAAKDAFRLGPVYSTGVGSGQGINHLFARYDGKANGTVMDGWSVRCPRSTPSPRNRGATGPTCCRSCARRGTAPI